MSTMKSIAIKDGKGPLSHLHIDASTPKPSLTGSQLLIKIYAFGINRMDLLQREGKYPLPPQAGPIMGVEFSGTVAQLGPDFHDDNNNNNDDDDKEHWQVGEKVFGLAYGGAYAEYITNPAQMTIKMPQELSFEQCAGLPEVWFTAIQALFKVGSLVNKINNNHLSGSGAGAGGSSKGERVLIHAGASGVGLAAIQLCKSARCSKIYATAGSDKKLALCKKLGATSAINYHSEDFAKVIATDQDDGGVEGQVDLILDFIGKDYWHKNIQIAARDCRIIYLATLSGSTLDKVDIGPILYKRLRIQGTTLRSRDLEYQADLRKRFEELALPHLKSGEFTAHIDKVYTMEQIQDAQGRMERNEGDGGKIICTIG